jgi:hypothetical protein
MKVVVKLAARARATGEQSASVRESNRDLLRGFEPRTPGGDRQKMPTKGFR